MDNSLTVIYAGSLEVCQVSCWRFIFSYMAIHINLNQKLWSPITPDRVKLQAQAKQLSQASYHSNYSPVIGSLHILQLIYCGISNLTSCSVRILIGTSVTCYIGHKETLQPGLPPLDSCPRKPASAACTPCHQAHYSCYLACQEEPPTTNLRTLQVEF